MKDFQIFDFRPYSTLTKQSLPRMVGGRSKDISYKLFVKQAH